MFTRLTIAVVIIYDFVLLSCSSFRNRDQLQVFIKIADVNTLLILFFNILNGLIYLIEFLKVS